jgi:transcriptional repressor NrdR
MSPKGEELVMHCPQCDQGTEVIDRRWDDTYQTIRKRRRCVYCGHRFSTLEMDVDQVESLLKTQGAR